MNQKTENEKKKRKRKLKILRAENPFFIKRPSGWVNEKGMSDPERDLRCFV